MEDIYMYEEPELILIDDDDDDDDVDDYRNARRVYHPRSGGSKRPRTAPPRRPNRRRSPPVRVGRRAPMVIRASQRPRPVVVAQTPDRISIRKDAVIELLPMVGQVWAAFLGMPDAPAIENDDRIDRENAAAHRQALAQHQQNQTRILALTNLATRAANLMIN